MHLQVGWMCGAAAISAALGQSVTPYMVELCDSVFWLGIRVVQTADRQGFQLKRHGPLRAATSELLQSRRADAERQVAELASGCRQGAESVSLLGVAQSMRRDALLFSTAHRLARCVLDMASLSFIVPRSLCNVSSIILLAAGHYTCWRRGACEHHLDQWVLVDGMKARNARNVKTRYSLSTATAEAVFDHITEMSNLSACLVVFHSGAPLVHSVPDADAVLSDIEGQLAQLH